MENDLFGIYESQIKEIQREKEYWNQKGECLGYDGTECPNCGRVRVEKYSKGEQICEKCHWNSTLQKYEDFGY